MIILASTSDLIRVVTSASVNVSVHTSSVDYNTVTSSVTPVRQNTLISTATTTTVVSSPDSNVSRNVKYIAITNNHASSSVDITIEHTDGTTVAQLWKQTLNAGQTITYSDDEGILNTTVSSAPSWFGKLYWAYGRCDPQQGLRMAQMAGTVAALPSDITTSLARIAYFRPPLDITVNRIRFYGVATVVGTYQCAIYDGNTLARLTPQLGTARIAVNNWYEFSVEGDILNLKLKGGALYFIAISVNTASSTAGLLCVSPTITSTTGQIAVLPKSWPGNLDLDLGYMDGGFAQFAVTSGALPNPAATIEAQGAWVGGFPLLLLDNSTA